VIGEIIRQWVQNQDKGKTWTGIRHLTGFREILENSKENMD